MTTPRAHTTAPIADDATLPPDRLVRLRGWTRPAIVANLVAQIVIVLTGGLVRLTSSGLGCDTWPMCQPGRFSPAFHSATSYHEFIEFGNRTLTGVLVVIAVLVALLAGTDRSRARAFRVLAFAPLAGVLLQAVVGGVVVLLDLNPAFVGLHYLISAALVWASTLLLFRAGEGDGPATATVDETTRRLGWLVGALLVPVLGLGVLVTGSGPHGGDNDVAYRFAVDPVWATRAHSGFVFVFVIALLWFGVVAFKRGAPDRVRNAFVLTVAVVLAQGAVGYVQYFTSLPIGLVALHMLGSALLTAATTWLVLTLRARDAAPAMTEASTAAEPA